MIIMPGEITVLQCTFGFVGLMLAWFTVRWFWLGRPVSDRIAKQGRSSFLGLYPMEFGYWLLAPMGRLAADWKLSPDFFSWGCFFLSLLGSYFMTTGQFGFAGLIFLLASSWDALDGMVARSRGIASDAGEVLDAAIDRYTEFFLLAGALIYYRFSVSAMLLVLFGLLGCFMVSYSQAKAEALNVSIPKGWMRRPERAIYMSLGAVAAPFLSPYFSDFSWGEFSMGSLNVSFLLAIVLIGVFANLTAFIRFQSMIHTLRQSRR